MAAWELVEGESGASQHLWQSTDCEGRRIYCVTRDMHGMAVEPNGANTCYSAKDAWARYREDTAGAD